MNERDDINDGLPHWAYSDDENLEEVVDRPTALSWDGSDGRGLPEEDEDEEAGRDHAWQDQDQDAAGAEPPSREAAQRLLDRPDLPWRGCL